MPLYRFQMAGRLSPATMFRKDSIAKRYAKENSERYKVRIAVYADETGDLLACYYEGKEIDL